MAVVPNLPALRKETETESGHSIAPPDRPGAWKALRLEHLAHGLLTPTTTHTSVDHGSIPDIWAQAQVFVDALDKRNHPMHQAAVTQWRALLATLALQPSRRTYSLSLLPPNLPERDEKGRSFGHAAATLIPRRSLDKRDWRTSALLFLQPKARPGARETKVLLGLLNPATLIAPARGFDGSRLENAPWLKEGLKDPTADAIADPKNDAGLRAPDYAVIVAFLDGLVDHLDALQTRSSDLYPCIREQLNKFRAACAARTLGNVGEAQAAEVDVEFLAGTGPKFKASDLLQGLFQSNTRHFVEPPDNSVSDTGVSVRTSSDADSGLKGLILVDATLVDTVRGEGDRKLSAHDIRVFRRYTLAQVQAPGVFEEMRKAAEAEGWFVARPEDFFAGEFVGFDEKTRLPAHPPGFENAALPLSPLALLVLDARQITKRLTVKTSTASVRVGLRLGLRSGKEHTVYFDFSLNPLPGQRRAVRDVTGQPGQMILWPNFEHPQWRWNFLRFENSPRNPIAVRFATSAALLSRWLKKLGGGDRVTEVRRLIHPDECLAPTDRVTSRVSSKTDDLQRIRLFEGERVEELQQSTFPFEAICIARRRERADTLHRPAGIVLAKRDSIDKLESDAVVGIDFGTTSSVTYLRKPGEKVGSGSPITFRDRLVLPIESTSGRRRDLEPSRWALVDFFPPSDNVTPVPTVAKRPAMNAGNDAQILLVQAGGENNGDRQPGDDRLLFSHVEFFLPGLSEDDATQAEDTQDLAAMRGQLEFGLKWGTTDYKKKVAARYLREFIMLTAAELFNEKCSPFGTDWRFSYPQALASEAEGFKARASECLNYVLGAPSTSTAPPLGDAAPADAAAAPAGLKPRFFTEAVASTAFFASDRENTADSLLVFDIGGGTTDVAFWRDGSLKWQASLLLAGGDFFTEYIYNNPQFLDSGCGLDLPQLGEVIRPKDDGDGSGDNRVKRDVVELIFYDRRFSRQLTHCYPEMRAGEAAGLRQAAMAAFAGMLFYSGRSLRALGLVHDINLLKICLGGRGSQLFKLFKDQSPESLTRLRHVFAKAAFDAGSTPTISFVQTDSPKAEVVRGMMLGDDALGQPASDGGEAGAGSPLGEEVTGRPLAGGDAVTFSAADDVSKLSRAGVNTALTFSLTQLNAFLDTLFQEGGIGVDLTELGEQQLKARARERYRLDWNRIGGGVTAPMRSRTAQVISPEPPFLTELRVLIAMMTGSKAERAKYVQVQEKG